MNRKFLSDVSWNIISAILPVIALQFAILPLVASKLDANAYGKLLTIVAMVNLSAATMGNVLNNSKLIHFKKYKEKNIRGDFNLLLLLFLFINLLFVLGGLYYFNGFNNVSSLVLTLSFSALLLFRGFNVVEFRINLNFFSIFIDSLILLVGYAFGYLLFVLTDCWEFIYFTGFGFSVIYILTKTTIYKEPFKKTVLYKSTLTQTLMLLFSGILVAIGTYVDRLLLFPILGGEMVSVYFTASILPKTALLLIHPITGVLLSYLAQIKTFNKKYFIKMLFGSILIGVVAYFAIILISKPFLSLIYPQFVTMAIPYISIIAIAVILMLITNTLNSVLLKFRNLKWQIIINAFFLIVYFTLSLVLLKSNGLWGFCLGILIANVVKLILTIGVFYLPSHKEFFFLSMLGMKFTSKS